MRPKEWMPVERLQEIQKRFKEASQAGQIELTNGGTQWRATGGTESDALNAAIASAKAK